MKFKVGDRVRHYVDLETRGVVAAVRLSEDRLPYMDLADIVWDGSSDVRRGYAEWQLRPENEPEPTPEERQIGAIAQALYQAERDTTSFTHNLQFHRNIARKIYAQGIRYVPSKWRVDESYVNEHGRRISNRWPTSYDSAEDAQRAIDTEVYGWTAWDPEKHTDRVREIHRER